MTETPLVSYVGGAAFARVCPVCGRFVKADDTITVRGLDDRVDEKTPNATCKRHGRVAMPFLGYYL